LINGIGRRRERRVGFESRAARESKRRGEREVTS
jgi:hypothetical protein